MEGLLKVFEKQAKENYNKIAIVCGEQALTYKDLYFQSYALSLFFKKEGIKFGEKVIIKSDLTPYYWVIYFATLLADGVFVSLDKNIPDNVFSNIINELGGCFAYVANSKNVECNNKYFSYEEIINASRSSKPSSTYDLYHDIEPERLTQIIYTTGTTGKSKGVNMAYLYHLNSAFEFDCLLYNKNTIMAVAAPLDHSLANGRTITVMLHGGTALQFNDLSDLEIFYRELEKYRVNSYAITPSAIKYLNLISQEPFANACKRAVFFEIGGEKMPKNNQEELISLAPNAHLFIGYAATECGPVGFYEFSKYGVTDNRVRKVDEGPEICLFNDSYEPIGTSKNVTGYIGVKKEFKCLGYHNSLDKHILIKNDFIMLSDYGYIDDEGFFCLQGRDGDTIVSGGYKVNPVEVENVCLKYFAVEDCVCYGVTNEIFGKIVTLDVVTKTGFDEKELSNHLINHLEINKVPKIINVVSKIERNKLGKIDRKFYRR